MPEWLTYLQSHPDVAAAFALGFAMNHLGLIMLWVLKIPVVRRIVLGNPQRAKQIMDAIDKAWDDAVDQTQKEEPK